MQIVCTTASAAARVLAILRTAQLYPVRDYELRPILSIVPPITFTMRQPLPDALRAEIAQVPDTRVVV